MKYFSIDSYQSPSLNIVNSITVRLTNQNYSFWNRQSHLVAKVHQQKEGSFIKMLKLLHCKTNFIINEYLILKQIIFGS